MGTFVRAQPCPNIGDTFDNGGLAWTGESQRISVCFSKNADTTPTIPSQVTFEKKWKRTTTTYYQETGSCEFYAYRTVTGVSSDGINFVPPESIPPYYLENTWFTGIITDNGKKIIMQATPGPNNPSYTVFGDITKASRRGRVATEISFTSSSSTGDMGTLDTFNRCSFTSWGTGARQPIP